MNIVVNGAPREFPDGIALTELLRALGLAGEWCAVAMRSSSPTSIRTVFIRSK